MSDQENSGISAGIAAIWERSRETVLGRVTTIESAAAALAGGSLSSDVRRAAEREAHKLAGVAGTFGFPNATPLAREAEHVFHGNASINQAGIARLLVIGAELREQLTAPSALPVADADAAAAPPLERKPARPAAPGRSEMVDVVVVEDDTTIAEVVEHALIPLGFSVRVIADGIAATAALAGRAAPLRARVILLDLGLPGQDGFAVLRALRQTAVTTISKVIMITAYNEQAEVIQAIKAGAADYIVKPFDVAELVSRVKRAVEVAA